MVPAAGGAVPESDGAGVGVRRGRIWALRSVSFRLDAPLSGSMALGVAISNEIVVSASAAFALVIHTQPSPTATVG